MTEKIIKKEYTNGEVTVIWQPHLCNHSSICLMKLPEVFRLSKRPWVDINAATTAQIVDIVKQCPTKALDYFMNSEKASLVQPHDEEKKEENEIKEVKDTTVIEVIPNGPLIIKGKLIIKSKEKELNCNEPSHAICRCGLSKKQPFCDGSHFGHKFE